MDKIRIIRKYYERSKTLKKLISLKAPKQIIEITSKRSKEDREELEKQGISENEIQEIINKYWIEWESDEFHIERGEKCLHSLRDLQKKMGELTPIKCPGGNIPCCSCPHFIEATEEQLLRYYHNQDINTGEKLPELDDE